MTSAKLPGAVLFDMDGVLVRSEEIWFRLVEEAGLRFRGRKVTREEFSPTFGQGTAADVEVFGLGCTPAELDAFYLERFAAHAHGVWVDPAALPLLRELRARGVKLAVVTNTVTALARDVLQEAGLLAELDALACADQVPQAKPAPDLVHRALELLGLGPDQAWLVGDSRYDREAAFAAGVFFVGYGIEGQARVESLPELLALLEAQE